MSKENYRPDIDGLRAVAVLAVVIYHAFPAALPGGFCGVDIFFVISGYLISGILFKSLAQEKFSFSEFYARRIRKLFPSLVVALSLTLAVGYYYLLSDEFEQLGKHAAASCVFFYSRASRGKSHRSNALSFQRWSLLSIYQWETNLPGWQPLKGKFCS